ncbi:MAG TPA: tetratricopeptide repeat protein [Polyangiaceae bacterium]
MEELASWLLEGLTSSSGKLVLRRRPAAAVKLYRFAAERGYAKAFLNLGYCHDVGLGTARNVEQAIHWYRKAVRAGDLAAASNLATLWREQGDARKYVYWRERAREMEARRSE